MTTAQLIGRFRQLTNYDFDPLIGLYPDTGSLDEQADWEAEVVNLLNEAMVELATDAYLVDPAVSLTLAAGVGTYLLEGSAFSKRIIEPFSVIVGGRRLSTASGEGPGLWTPTELNRCFPTWPTDGSGTVARAVWAGDRLVLHPSPVSGGMATVEARILPSPLSVDELSAEPELPVRLHPAIAQRAMYNACSINAQESSQFKRLSDMVAEATAIAQEIGRTNREARFGSPRLWAGTEPEIFCA